MPIPEDDDPWFLMTPIGPVPANWKGWLLALIVVGGSTVLGIVMGILYPGQHGLPR